jgi:hypothetical protein
MWLNILFSPYMSIVRSRRRFPREESGVRPDNMTGRPSEEEQSEAEERTIALHLRRGYTRSPQFRSSGHLQPVREWSP